MAMVGNSPVRIPRNGTLVSWTTWTTEKVDDLPSRRYRASRGKRRHDVKLPRSSPPRPVDCRRAGFRRLRSHHERNQRRNALRVVRVGLAEPPAHDGLLDLQLVPERRARERDGEHAAPLAERQRAPEEGDENAGVDRMADPAIGTGDDELMVAFERDVRAPVAPEQ